MPTTIEDKGVMKHRPKELWLHHLRRAEHQCTGRLRRREKDTDGIIYSYSAVGLLCLTYKEKVGGSFVKGGRGFVDNECVLRLGGAPPHLLEWAGLEGHTPGVRFGALRHETIVALNDGLRHFDKLSLSGIAEIVSERL